MITYLRMITYLHPFEYPALTIIRRIISYKTPYFCASCLIVFWRPAYSLMAVFFSDSDKK